MPTLVVVFAGNCGHCVNLQPQWPAIEASLRKAYPQLEIVVIHLQRMDSPIPSKYPKSLNKHVRSFPTVLLVPSTEWKNDSITSPKPYPGVITTVGVKDWLKDL
jgi:thiol-disulfide isomerase/thioredoxin